jgi:hypothetical protein
MNVSTNIIESLNESHSNILVHTSTHIVSSLTLTPSDIIGIMTQKNVLDGVHHPITYK